MRKKFLGKPADSFAFKEILYDKKDSVARVTINRPEAYNAYTAQTVRELFVAFKDAMWDDGIAAIVLTGAGDKAFCTGGDVKEYAEVFTQRPRDYWKWMGEFIECHDLLRNIGKPAIARINGIVAGGGNEFYMSCDPAVMADHKFPECTRYTKTQVNFWKDMAWSQTVRHAHDWLSLQFATTEPYEGMTAFVEKRAPRYREMRSQRMGHPSSYSDHINTRAPIAARKACQAISNSAETAVGRS